MKEVKAEARTGGKPVAQVMAAEAERIERAVPADDILVAMDEHGRDMTTLDFSKKISGWKNEGCGVTFIIGGADGLDPALKAKSRMMLRLSSMTLPHAFARVPCQSPLSPRLNHARFVPCEQKSSPPGDSRRHGNLRH